MRRARARGLVVIGASLLFACSTAPSAGTSDDDIQDGKRERGYAAVGVVHQVTAQSFCTGTLIAPDLVLTAGHCVEAGEQIDAFYTGPGRAVADASTDPESLGMVRHDVAAYALYPSFEYFLDCPNPAPDVALVRLKTPITDISPAKLGEIPAVGDACRTVGYGVHRPKGKGGDAGTPQFLEKRSASVSISEVREGSFDAKAITGLAEHGDSGGPLYCAGALVGLTSCQPDFPLDAVSYVNVASAERWISAMAERWDPEAAARIVAGP